MCKGVWHGRGDGGAKMCDDDKNVGPIVPVVVVVVAAAA
jgi:hypothetical protein